MEISFLGNQSLLQLPNTAFLASNTIPVEMVLKCYDWAAKMRDEKRCIISGFSSKLEKDIWDFLISGCQPIILVLARDMFRRIPSELQPLLDNGRLLIVSTTTSSRQSKTTALTRNRYICEHADHILFVGADEHSSLYPLRQHFAFKEITNI